MRREVEKKKEDEELVLKLGFISAKQEMKKGTTAPVGGVI